MQPKYDYTQAGFNGFLSRSKKANPLAMSLGDGASQGSGGTINLDRQQIGGSLGNILPLGRIILDGVTGRIRIQDEHQVDTTWLGNLVP